MSDMKLQVAIRFKHSSGYEKDKVKLSTIRALLGEPDQIYDQDEESDLAGDFWYDHANHGGWSLNLIGDSLYLTRFLEEEYAASDVDVSLDQTQIEEIVKEAHTRWFYKEDCPPTPPYLIRVLYQYTGGCAGLSELV